MKCSLIWRPGHGFEPRLGRIWGAYIVLLSKLDEPKIVYNVTIYTMYVTTQTNMFYKSLVSYSTKSNLNEKKRHKH